MTRYFLHFCTFSHQTGPSDSAWRSDCHPLSRCMTKHVAYLSFLIFPVGQ